MELIFWLIGLFIGTNLGSIIKRKYIQKPIGTLKVVCDEDGEYLFLELHENVKSVRSRKTVTFNVKNVDTQH